MNLSYNSGYKKPNAIQDIRHSCFGKMLVIIVVFGIITLIAAFTRPSDSMMRWQAEDNIIECIIASDSIQSDFIDDYVGNLGRILTHADKSKLNRETWKVFNKHNKIAIYSHVGFKTAYIHNNVNPDGVRVAIGIFGVVIPTITYSDMLLNLDNVRGEYGQRLIRSTTFTIDSSIGSTLEELLNDSAEVKAYE